MELSKLDKFRSLIQQFANENELDMGDIAAALTFENQKERPLFPKLENITSPSRRDHDRNSGRERNKDLSRRKEKRVKSEEFQDASNSQKKKPAGDSKRQSANHSRDGIAMTTYRLEVGNNDKITPSNIVGAIANEADIDSRYIGEIKLHDDYSTVDLPEGMPNELLNHLKKVRICAKPMKLSPFSNNANQALKYGKDEHKPRSPRKRAITDDKSDKKTISRNVKTKRTAEKTASNKQIFDNTKKDGKVSITKKSKSKKRVTDGSAPLKKKKKTYTKKPKRAK